MEYPRLMYRNGNETKRVESEADAVAAQSDGWTLRRHEWCEPAPVVAPEAVVEVPWPDIDAEPEQDAPKKKGRGKAH